MKQFVPRLSRLLLILLFVPLNVGAERLPVKIYTSADGLGSSFIDFLMRDSRGFMWFCTRDGLSRFDGSRFVTYRVGDKNAPPGIESLYQTRDGAYWITTTAGLYRFRPDAVSQVNDAIGDRPFLNAEFVATGRGPLLEDRNGTLWYGSNDLYTVSELNGKFTFAPGPFEYPFESQPSVQHVPASRSTRRMSLAQHQSGRGATLSRRAARFVSARNSGANGSGIHCD
jgi:hypothetical protein